MIRVHECPTFPENDEDLGHLPEAEDCHILYMSLCMHCIRSKWSWHRSPCAIPGQGPIYKVDHSSYGCMTMFALDPAKPKRWLVPVVRWIRLPKDILIHIQSYLALPELDKAFLDTRRNRLTNIHYDLNGYYSYHKDYGIYGNFYKCAAMWDGGAWNARTNLEPVSKKRRLTLESHWLAENLTCRSRRDRPFAGSLLRLYENVASLRVEVPHEGMLNNVQVYRGNASHKSKLDDFEATLGAKNFREGLELFDMLYLNGEGTRLYHHYPGDLLK